MKSSNKFVVVVFAVVLVKDDGYIHASTAVVDVAAEVDTTFIYICMFFFLFQKFQISRIESIYWTALTACLEEQKNEKNERVYI
jgi:hypothetical protein